MNPMPRFLDSLLRIVTTTVLTCIWLSTATATAAGRDEVVFFMTDHLGSAVTAVDENGKICWSETYTPYGDKTINEDLVNRIGCGIIGEERGYTGHTEDKAIYISS